MQNVINQFTKLAQDPRISFLGNVTVGRDISLATLRRHYNGVRRFFSSPPACVLQAGQRQIAGVGIGANWQPDSPPKSCLLPLVRWCLHTGQRAIGNLASQERCVPI